MPNGRSLPERQVDLCAARKTRAIGTLGLTGTGIDERQTFKLKAFAGAAGDLKRAPGEPSYRLVPDTLIEPDRQATTAGDTRHSSAFAVGRIQLAHEFREVLATGRRRAEPLMHGTPRFGRRYLQQLRRQLVHPLGNPLGLLRTQTPDRRHRPLDTLKLPLKLAYGVVGGHGPNGSSRGWRHRTSPMAPGASALHTEKLASRRTGCRHSCGDERGSADVIFACSSVSRYRRRSGN